MNVYVVLNLRKTSIPSSNGWMDGWMGDGGRE